MNRHLTTHPLLSKLFYAGSFLVIAVLSYSIVWTNAWYDGFGHGYSQGIYDAVTDPAKALSNLVEFMKSWE